jgi:uncharacterized RDD family membrane protein YckC
VITSLVMLLILSGGQSIEAPASGPFSSPGWLLALLGLIAFFFLWGYYIFFETLWNGKTPGKSLVKLRVIRTDGTPISLTESVVRNLVRIIDFLPLYYGVGVIAMFINRQSRRLGDLAAGTLVVHDTAEKVHLASLAPGAGLPARPAAAPETRPAAGPNPAYPVERLAEQDILVIESFFKRRAQLSNRASLARQLAQRMFERMQMPAGAQALADPEETLAGILDAYRQRLG